MACNIKIGNFLNHNFHNKGLERVYNLLQFSTFTLNKYFLSVLPCAAYTIPDVEDTAVNKANIKSALSRNLHSNGGETVPKNLVHKIPTVLRK